MMIVSLILFRFSHRAFRLLSFAMISMGTTLGRPRLSGRARPAVDRGVRVWLVLECGTLAADPSAGTLGFGVLDGGGRAVSARPVWVGAGGGFSFHATHYKAPAPRSLIHDRHKPARCRAGR